MINTRSNSTRYVTKTASLPDGQTIPINENGTRTCVQDRGDGTSITLTYPTLYRAYDSTYTWTGTLLTHNTCVTLEPTTTPYPAATIPASLIPPPVFFTTTTKTSLSPRQIAITRGDDSSSSSPAGSAQPTTTVEDVYGLNVRCAWDPVWAPQSWIDALAEVEAAVRECDQSAVAPALEMGE
ncbi:hypothetical protein UCRNP2_1028 [Neofusicoccum parvum UCRNP2]|uniref:Uncharacterized protein n=1 Tax=Botryosphaeria parva (strain UCR-NP2) TaxID=1287680 RepID=R1GKD6_BOTPV|nr:hypothetical protein UCRNP2_1028 [Neofusicoccum parvum UCRNP2]